jgi:hypothetical protein
LYIHTYIHIYTPTHTHPHPHPLYIYIYLVILGASVREQELEDFDALVVLEEALLEDLYLQLARLNTKKEIDLNMRRRFWKIGISRWHRYLPLARFNTIQTQVKTKNVSNTGV